MQLVTITNPCVRGGVVYTFWTERGAELLALDLVRPYDGGLMIVGIYRMEVLQ